MSVGVGVDCSQVPRGEFECGSVVVVETGVGVGCSQVPHGGGVRVGEGFGAAHEAPELCGRVGKWQDFS